MPSATYGFNGNPSSVSVKTGSYTIPANKYAYITANCENGATFSIDGTVALSSNNWSVLAKSTGNIYSTTGVASYTAGSAVEGVLTSSNANATTSGSGATDGDPVFTNATAMTAVVANFWVPTGTVLTTSSGRYTVQLF